MKRIDPEVIAWQQTSSWYVPWAEKSPIDRNFALEPFWRYVQVQDEVIRATAIEEWMEQNKVECVA
jgi:hypothetical protein